MPLLVILVLDFYAVTSFRCYHQSSESRFSKICFMQHKQIEKCNEQNVRKNHDWKINCTINTIEEINRLKL